MAETAQDIAEANPFVVTKGAEETDGEFVRFEATMLPPPGEELVDVDLPHERWGLDNGQEHVHPKQEEWFEVLSGELTVAYEGNEVTLTEGEEITLPKNVPHTHWNPTDEPTRLLWERRPARESETWLETSYALAQAGKTDEDGVPESWLQLAVWLDEYPDDTYVTLAPVSILKLLMAILAPFGRLAGYEPEYTHEGIADGG
jgi:mannose-6-phosphate isomerase-like protein (cupin superfamily)